MILHARQDLDPWSVGLERWKRVTDALGKSIDPGIFETVVALNLLSIQTFASCEGHMHRGLPYPWIDIGLPRAEYERQEERWHELNACFLDLCEKRPDGTILDLSPEAIEKLQQRNAVAQEIRQMHTVGISKLMGYLQRFYASHHPPYECVLAFHSIDTFGMLRMFPVGGTLSETLPEEQKRTHLLAYQEEMRLFTAFLKARLRDQEINKN